MSCKWDWVNCLVYIDACTGLYWLKHERLFRWSKQITLPWELMNDWKQLPCVLQVESGFFLECDVKIVGKSIRDRVALIKWRRERKVLTGNGEAPVKKAHENLLQVPISGVPHSATKATTECEDQELELQTLICTLPTTMSAICKNLQTLSLQLSHTMMLSKKIACKRKRDRNKKKVTAVS